ncbi:MAG: nucleotidyltransferase family protein [Patescibacteria group bacterium]
MSKELEIIKKKITENKAYLREIYGVEEIGLFGSYTRGEQTPESDVDVVVTLNQKKVSVGLFEFCNLERFLENLLNKKVDLVTKRSIRPAFQKYILPTILYI